MKIRDSKPAKTAKPNKAGHKIHQLGWWLVFAVVYADIGTSIFYVPAILYLSIGNLATLAQVITTGVFISTALKYVEICERCPDGGGVISITREAFSKWTALPMVGGAFITVDYFLTSAISGVSGLFYLATLIPGAKAWVVPASAVLFLFLIFLNIVGIKESAVVSAFFSTAKVLVTLLLLAAAALFIQGGHDLSWAGLWSSIFHPGVPLTFGVLMVGYADTWLAYSGLESLAQISGAMKQPIRATASKAMWWVIGAIAIISPPITAAAIYVLPESVKRGDPESLMSSLAFLTGGWVLGMATVIAASTLLFMACNTAIVGNYHVNVRLADLGFMPAFLRKRHPRLGTPYLSIIISGLVPLVIILAARGSITLLGDLYAFGLLGTLTLSSLAVDRLRWRDGIRGLKFWSGFLTSIAILSAWLINMVHKPYALLFGGVLSVVMILIGLDHRDRVGKEARRDFAKAEAKAAAEGTAEDVLSLEEASAGMSLESSPLLVAVRNINPALLDSAATQAKGLGARNVYLIFIDELPGLFVPPDVKPSAEARRVLSGSGKKLESHGLTAIPIWRMAEDAGTSLADAAQKLRVKFVLLGSSQRSLFWRMLRGRMLNRLTARLPVGTHLLVLG